MSLSYRMLLLLFLPMFLLLGTYGFAAHELRRMRYLERAVVEVTDLSWLLRAALSEERADADRRHETALLEELSSPKHVLGIAVFDATGKLSSVSHEITSHLPAMQSVARRVLESGEDATVTSPPGSPGLIVGAALFSNGRGVVVVGRELAYIDHDVAEADRVLGATALLLLIATALPALWVVRRTIIAPTQSLVSGVERVSAGDLEARVREGGAVELSRLARAFNAMTASLLAAREEAQLAARARAQLERRLQHSQALAAAGQVAASVAHEIGSPLNIILGRARLSAEDPSCPEPVRQDLQNIAEQCERISRVVRQLLEVARAPDPAAGAESVQAREVASRVIEFVSAEGRARGVSLTLEAGEPVKVATHPDKLFQMLFNLCMNAMQAQPDGGNVRIRVGEGSSPLSGERCACIDVEDDGPGVPTELLGKIVHPFFTTKRPGEGSGLGLAIVDGLARESGGKLDLENLPEKGARFRVMLPLASLSPPSRKA